MSNLLKNHASILDNITLTQKKQKNDQRVILLAVSKKKPASDIRALYQVGQVHFGENYLQEALEKQGILTDLDICWHYIGHIQRNKTKDIATHFDWVHTVDREIIAKRLSNHLNDLTHPKIINVCIQINIDKEASKSGCMPSEAIDLAIKINQLPHIKLRGLMVIPNPKNNQFKENAFARTKQLFDDIALKLNSPHWDTLSMGMSADFSDAIAHGATIIRVGSAIFGARD